MRYWFAIILRSLAVVWVAGVSCAQDFPSKPVRIVTAEPGGGNDVAARLIAQGLTQSMGLVIVENRGGSVIVSAEVVGKAPPDGYTLLLYANSLWILPFMRENVRYDPVKDFSPITLATSSPSILIVTPSLPVKSVKELIALARAKPAALNYGAAPGGIIHIAAELFKALAGVNVVHIAYKGGAPALTALFGGEIQLMFPTAGTVAAFVNSNKLRALAVTSAKPSALFPTLPTIADSGVPGYEAVARLALFAPAKTPAAVINQLNQEIVRVLNQPDIKEKFHAAGIETIGTSPAELAAAMKEEMRTLGRVIKDAGIRAE